MEAEADGNGRDRLRSTWRDRVLAKAAPGLDAFGGAYSDLLRGIDRGDGGVSISEGPHAESEIKAGTEYVLRERPRSIRRERIGRLS